MPKVIKNLKDNILVSAKEELFKNGYKELNMRSLANLNNTAVGTIYNYFPSKDILVATIVLSDWQISLSKISEISSDVKSAEEGIELILSAITSFYSIYHDVFKSFGLKNVKSAYPDKYNMMIDAIGLEIRKILDRFSIKYTDFEITFIVTSILASVTNCWPFEQTIRVLSKIIKES